MKNRLIYLVLIIFLLGIFNSVSAYYIGSNYAYVRSNSFYNFAPVQYANYYDNIDFAFSLYSNGFTNAVPIVVSPLLYGVDAFGSSVFLRSIPPQTFYLSPYTPFDYTYSNMFYFDPDYTSYKIQLNASTLDGKYKTTKDAYVYYKDASVNNNTDEQVDCSKFYLSGLNNISVPEDSRDYYKLYFVNTINQPLDITSMHVDDVPNLDITNIQYPPIVNAYTTKSTQLDLFSDTVSSDYSNTFNISVSAKYGNLVCNKVYSVNYKINNKLNDSSADCSNIQLDNISLTTNELTNKNFQIGILNKSNDYDFEINSATVSSADYGDVSIVYYPDKVYLDSTKYLKLKYNSEAVNSDKYDYLDVKLKGDMTRSGREPKSCNIYKTIKVKVQNTNSNGNPYECSNIVVHSNDLEVSENSLTNNNVTITNNSNNKFIINNVVVSSNTNLANVKNVSYQQVIYPHTTDTVNFNLQANNVQTNESSLASVKVYGSFDNSVDCTYSAINSSFRINILNSTDVCKDISVANKHVVAGNNLITVTNNSNSDFILIDGLFQNVSGLNLNLITNNKVILANSTTNLQVGVSGTGSADLYLKGGFRNGAFCDYLQTTKGTLSTNTINLQDDCSFQLTVPSVYTINNSNSYNISFNNLTNKNGTIQITSDGATVNYPLIYLSGLDSFNKQLILSDISNINDVSYTVKLNGCSPKVYNTSIVIKTVVDNTPLLKLLSYPSNLQSSHNTISTTVQVENSSSNSNVFNLSFENLPKNWKVYYSLNSDLSNKQETGTFTIAPNSTEIVFIEINRTPDSSKTYTGTINLKSNNTFISKVPLAISISSNNYLDADYNYTYASKNKYLFNLNLKNNSSSPKTIIINFNKQNDWNIFGDSEVTLNANESKSRPYSLMFNDSNESTIVLPTNFIDKSTGTVELTKNLLFEHKKNSLFTGFTIFSGVGGLISLILLILIILALLWYYVWRPYRLRKREEISKRYFNKNGLVTSGLTVKPKMVVKEQSNVLPKTIFKEHKVVSEPVVVKPVTNSKIIKKTTMVTKNNTKSSKVSNYTN